MIYRAGLSTRSIVLTAITASAWAILIAAYLIMHVGDLLQSSPWLGLTVAVAVILAVVATASVHADRLAAHIDRRYERIRTALVQLGARVDATGEIQRGDDVPRTDRGYIDAFELGVDVGRVTPLDSRRMAQRSRSRNT